MSAALLLCAAPLSSDPVPVRYTEGSVHGFLVLRSSEGKVLAAGDLTQLVRGGRIISHLVFRFRDGSVDEETASFTQRGTFRLVSDHRVQRGPTFEKPIDVSIKVPIGEVTVRYKDKDKLKVETAHLDLPDDLANGMILNVMKNIAPDARETKLSYLAATPKPRIVKLSITPKGEEQFLVAGTRRNASHLDMKVDLGGVLGFVAPMVGKQPPDVNVWILGGEVPAFIKSEGPIFLGGPVWTIEMTSPVWKQPSVYIGHRKG